MLSGKEERRGERQRQRDRDRDRDRKTEKVAERMTERQRNIEDAIGGTTGGHSTCVVNTTPTTAVVPARDGARAKGQRKQWEREHLPMFGG